MAVNYEFRKKPVAVEAFQLTEERRADNSDWPEWLHEAWGKGKDKAGAMWPHMIYGGSENMIFVGTPEGAFQVKPGDWIIREAEGLYICAPDIFAETYESVKGD